MPVPPPAKIRLDRSARMLELDWPDGRRCRYPWAFLRGRCPSAGERQARLDPKPPDPLAVLGKAPSEEITELRTVGSYAIQFTFADGHGAGIYTWDYLSTLADDPRVEKTSSGGRSPLREQGQ
jgi:DUF971 family protein